MGAVPGAVRANGHFALIDHELDRQLLGLVCVLTGVIEAFSGRLSHPTAPRLVPPGNIPFVPQTAPQHAGVNCVVLWEKVCHARGGRDWLAAHELQRWLVGAGFAVLHAGLLVATEKALEVGGALAPNL